MSSTETKVHSIYICPEAGGVMRRVEMVNAIAGVGLEGDRYAIGVGFWQTLKNPRPTTRHLSLISLQDIEEASQELGIEYPANGTRRNVVVNGEIKLLDLVNEEFQFGDVLLRGVEECDPCNRPSKFSGIKGFEKAFKANGRGGLRAEILSNGLIQVNQRLIRAT